MESDKQFYEFARAHPGAFLALLCGRVPALRYRVRSFSLKAAERRLDMGFLLEERERGDCWLVECHGYADRHVERKFFVRSVMAAQQLDLWGRVRTGIVYTTRQVALAALPPRLGPADAPVDLAPVRVVLDQIPPDDLLALSPELFPLLPLCKVTRRGLRKRLGAWWDRARTRVRVRPHRSELTDHFLRFYAARYPRDRMNVARGLLEEVMDFKDTRIGQDLIEIGVKLGEKRGVKLGEKRGVKLGEKRGVKLGEKRGVKLGEKRGEKLGELRALRQALRDVVEARFKRVPNDLGCWIESCPDRRRLKTLLRKAATDPDLDAIRRRLERAADT
ncbi:MAG: DUF2887 domain-containing protein [Planctomycetes bacterium]|nr:DUF2887 domain-containing protein [Planctomycetota bacterium]